MRPPGQIAHGSHPSGPLLGAPQQRALPNTFQCRSFQPNPAHAQQAAAGWFLAKPARSIGPRLPVCVTAVTVSQL